MNKITYLFLASLFVLFFSSLTFASSYVSDDTNYSISSGTMLGSGLISNIVLDVVKDEINSSDRALALFNYVGDGKINIVDETSKTTIGAVVANGKLSSLTLGALSSPNYIVTVKLSARNAIMISSDPAVEAKKQIQSGGIVIQPQGIIETLKVFFFSIISGFI